MCCATAQAEEQEERGSGGSMVGAAGAHNGQRPKVCLPSRRAARCPCCFGQCSTGSFGLPLLAPIPSPCTVPLHRASSCCPQVVTEVWLVSEFCNRGPLLTAIERGAFLTQPSSQYGQPNLISVLQVGRLAVLLMFGA